MLRIAKALATSSEGAVESCPLREPANQAHVAPPECNTKRLLNSLDPSVHLWHQHLEYQSESHRLPLFRAPVCELMCEGQLSAASTTVVDPLLCLSRCILGSRTQSSACSGADSSQFSNWALCKGIPTT